MDATTFLDAAGTAEQLIGSTAVADRWEDASALEGYSVGGLAGHLARAVLTVEHYLDQPVPDGAPTDAAGYLVRALASHDPVSSDFHGRVRQRGEQVASRGQEALVAELREARLVLTDRLAAVESGRHLAVLDGTVLPIEEYLETRLVELVVHLDDLAVSVAQDGPGDLPAAAFETVAAVLARVAVRRAGPLATIRSLARRERHPEAVRAL